MKYLPYLQSLCFRTASFCYYAIYHENGNIFNNNCIRKCSPLNKYSVTRSDSPEQQGRCEWSPDPGPDVAQGDVDISCASEHQRSSLS